MKNTQILEILFPVLLIFCFACGQANERSAKIFPSEESFVPDTTYTAFCGDTLKRIDKIIEGFNVKFSMIEANEKVYRHGVDWEGKKLLIEYCDRYIDLLISHDGIEVLPELRITKSFFSDIIPENEIQKLTITFFDIIHFSDSGIEFLIDICEPDTDICYPIDILVTQKGEIIITKRDVEEYY